MSCSLQATSPRGAGRFHYLTHNPHCGEFSFLRSSRWSQRHSHSWAFLLTQRALFASTHSLLLPTIYGQQNQSFCQKRLQGWDPEPHNNAVAFARIMDAPVLICLPTMMCLLPAMWKLVLQTTYLSHSPELYIYGFNTWYERQRNHFICQLNMKRKSSILARV